MRPRAAALALQRAEPVSDSGRDVPRRRDLSVARIPERPVRGDSARRPRRHPSHTSSGMCRRAHRTSRRSCIPGPDLHGGRRRGHHVRRRKDGRARVAGAPRRRVHGVAAGRRRKSISLQRDGRDDRLARRPNGRGAGAKHDRTAASSPRRPSRKAGSSSGPTIRWSRSAPDIAFVALRPRATSCPAWQSCRARPRSGGSGCLARWPERPWPSRRASSSQER